MESLALGSEVEYEVDIRKWTEQLHVGVEVFLIAHFIVRSMLDNFVLTEGLSDLR
jgi:hypothetical protein